MGAPDLPRRPVVGKFLHGTIVPANAYWYTKFQLSSSISLGDMRGSQNKNWELLISLADKFLCRALVHINAYNMANFNFLGPLVTETWRLFKNKKWVLLISPDAP